MSKKCNGCKFSQGIILGAIGGFLAGYFFKENSHLILPEKQEGEEKEGKPPKSKEKTEELINKTLDAIDKGFDKINTMITDIKKDDTKK